MGMLPSSSPTPEPASVTQGVYLVYSVRSHGKRKFGPLMAVLTRWRLAGRILNLAQGYHRSLQIDEESVCVSGAGVQMSE